MGGEKAGDSGTGRRDHGWQSTRRDEGLYDEQFTWISSFSLQTEEREVCPVCFLSTGGGEEYKTHLRLCLENNVPRVRTNQQVLLEARGSLVCDDQIKEESAANDDLEREESEESSSSDEEEACDARQLYPCKEKRESQYFYLLERRRNSRLRSESPLRSCRSLASPRSTSLLARKEFKKHFKTIELY